MIAGNTGWYFCSVALNPRRIQGLFFLTCPVFSPSVAKILPSLYHATEELNGQDGSKAISK
jgi:hypothetical protein